METLKLTVEIKLDSEDDPDGRHAREILSDPDLTDSVLMVDDAEFEVSSVTVQS